jgi:hypothetical protein
MDEKHLAEFRRIFDEEQINKCCKQLLANLSVYFYKKNPELQDAVPIWPPKNSRSVLDLCVI